MVGTTTSMTLWQREYSSVGLRLRARYERRDDILEAAGSLIVCPPPRADLALGDAWREETMSDGRAYVGMPDTTDSIAIFFAGPSLIVIWAGLAAHRR